MISLFDTETILRAYTKEREDAAQIEGEARGEARGETRGKMEKAIEVAKKMIRKDMQPDLIAELSGLTLSEVNQLKAQKAT